MWEGMPAVRSLILVLRSNHFSVFNAWNASPRPVWGPNKSAQPSEHTRTFVPTKHGPHYQTYPVENLPRQMITDSVLGIPNGGGKGQSHGSPIFGTLASNISLW